MQASRFTVLLGVLALVRCGGTTAAPDAAGTDTAPPADALFDTFEAEALADASEAVDTTPLPWWHDLAGEGLPVRQRVGVSSHMAQGPGPDALRDFELATYAALGGLRLREDFYWSAIEPADDAWNLDAVRTQVELAVAQGTGVLPLLVYGNGWATSDGTTDGLDLAEYGEFAARVAAEYCDTVKEYELWNEPNLPSFWHPEPNVARYGDLVKAATPAIKAACPDARVLVGALSSVPEQGFSDVWGFLDELAAAHPDLGDFLDVLSAHPYTFAQYPSPEHDDVRGAAWNLPGQSGMTALLRAKLAALGRPDAPLQFTEIGWPSYELSEEQVARYLARSLLLALRDGVEVWYWYTFWDGEPITTGVRPHENYFGLFGWAGPDGTVRRAKPAFRALEGGLAAVGDLRFARDLSADLGLPADVVALAFTGEAGQLVLAAWDGRDDPDVTPDGEQSGGPDTSYELDLPWPDGRVSADVLDLEGSEVGPLPAGSPTLTLSPSVAYVVFH